MLNSLFTSETIISDTQFFLFQNITLIPDKEDIERMDLVGKWQP